MGAAAIQELIGGNLSRMPFLASIETKIKSTGWVSPMWSIVKEISPVLDGVSSSLIEPFIAKYISGIPDESIPQLAHNVVDDAIKNGGLSLFEGKVEFEPEDLEELKTLLKYNLPIQESAASYSVLTEEPTPQGEDADEK